MEEESGFDDSSLEGGLKSAKSLGTCKSDCTCPRHKKSQGCI
jgi:hypothetical protein